MRARIGVIAVGLAGCLCSALIHLVVPEPSNAGDEQRRVRHSLITRPSPLSDTKAPGTLFRRPEHLKPLSLVIPMDTAREGQIKPSSIPSRPSAALPLNAIAEDGAE